MVRPEVLRKKLAKLAEYLEILEGLQRYDYDAFVASPERYAILARERSLAEDAKERWIRMIGFRNVLVYDYAEIDR